MTCPWCGSEKIFHNTHVVYTSPYLVVELHGAKIPVQTITSFSTCDCGLTFQENRFSDEWYNWFYSSGTYRQTLGISQEEMDADEQRRADDLVEWLSVFDEMNVSSHIDVGASKGCFSSAIGNKYKCMSYAVDLNRERILGIKPPDDNFADLVSAIHVLEHVTDPIKELTTWASMTSKYLLIETPGLNTIGGPLRFAHLYYFPPELLKAKIIELGFNIVAMETEPNTRILGEKK